VKGIPTYTMQRTKIPMSVCNELDRKVQRFLWGRGTAMELKTHLVAWEVVTRKKDKGGLGLTSMTQLNSAFLMK